MQAAAAFVSVQVALNWFVDNFVRVAQWVASAKRVDELVEALEALYPSVVGRLALIPVFEIAG
jgi:putative ATP-binding cassette transporter